MYDRDVVFADVLSLTMLVTKVFIVSVNSGLG